MQIGGIFCKILKICLIIFATINYPPKKFATWTYRYLVTVSCIGCIVLDKNLSSERELDLETMTTE
jgi:hypothetical protein